MSASEEPIDVMGPAYMFYLADIVHLLFPYYTAADQGCQADFFLSGIFFIKKTGCLSYCLYFL